MSLCAAADCQSSGADGVRATALAAPPNLPSSRHAARTVVWKESVWEKSLIFLEACLKV